MFGLLDRKRPDADAVRPVKALVADRFDLPETTTLAVAELRCDEPGSRLSRPSLPREASSILRSVFVPRGGSPRLADTGLGGGFADGLQYGPNVHSADGVNRLSALTGKCYRDFAS